MEKYNSHCCSTCGFCTSEQVSLGSEGLLLSCPRSALALPYLATFFPLSGAKRKEHCFYVQLGLPMLTYPYSTLFFRIYYYNGKNTMVIVAIHVVFVLVNKLLQAPRGCCSHALSLVLSCTPLPTNGWEKEHCYYAQLGCPTLIYPHSTLFCISITIGTKCNSYCYYTYDF